MTTAQDGKKYKTKHYNPNVIISVGYRVKSLRGTQFTRFMNLGKVQLFGISEQFLIYSYCIKDIAELAYNGDLGISKVKIRW